MNHTCTRLHIHTRLPYTYNDCTYLYGCRDLGSEPGGDGGLMGDDAPPGLDDALAHSVKVPRKDAHKVDHLKKKRDGRGYVMHFQSREAYANLGTSEEAGKEIIYCERREGERKRTGERGV